MGLAVALFALPWNLPDATPSPLTELLLYLADRAQHLDELIRPALVRGEVVLSDRFSASTIAYQGYARHLDVDLVTRLDAIVRGDVSPVLTVLLDCPVSVGLPRAKGRVKRAPGLWNCGQL